MLLHFLDSKHHFGAFHLKCLDIVTYVHIDSLSESEPLLHAWISVANGSSFLLVTFFLVRHLCKLTVPWMFLHLLLLLFTIPLVFSCFFFHCCFYTYSKPKLLGPEGIAFQSWNGSLQCQNSSWQRQVQELDKNTESNLCFEWIVFLSRWAAVYFHASFSACNNNVVFLFCLLGQLLSHCNAKQLVMLANPIVMVATNNMHILILF